MKNLLFYGIVGLIGVSIVVGVVFFLRARNAPVEIGTVFTGAPASKTSSPTPSTGGQKTKPLRPFVPIEQTPKAPEWKEGDPLPTTSDEITIP